MLGPNRNEGEIPCLGVLSPGAGRPNWNPARRFLYSIRFAPEDFATRHLPDVLARFAHAYPQVDLEVTCDLTMNLIERFRKGAFDLALIKRERSFEMQRVATKSFYKPERKEAVRVRMRTLGTRRFL